MPYHIGAKGSNGCSGYPVLSDKGHVAGCHATETEAIAQLDALYANVPDASKAYDGCGCETCKELNVNCENCPVCKANEMKSDCCPDLNKQAPCWDGYVQRGMKEQDGKMVPNCVPAEKADTPMDVAYNPIITDPEPANPSSHINPSAGMKKPQYMMNFGRQIGSGIKDKRVVDIWTVKADTPPTPENPIMPTNTYQGCDCDMCEEQQIPCSSCPMCGGGMDAETEMSTKSMNNDTQNNDSNQTQQESFFNFRDIRPTRNNVIVGDSSQKDKQ